VLGCLPTYPPETQIRLSTSIAIREGVPTAIWRRSARWSKAAVPGWWHC
jgi:hypothetical protein